MPRSSKMVAKFASGICPPGFLCMSNATLIAIFFATVCVFILGLIFAKQYGIIGTKTEHHIQAKPTVVVIRQAAAPQIPRALPVINPDPRFSPMAPEQVYNVPPDISTGNPLPAGAASVIPINVQTRGYSDTFQQIGVLTAPGGTETSGSPNRTILPLFGRKLMANRDRWNYYTRTDGMNPVQVPVQFKRRDCDDDTGCDEVLNGDSVGVPILGQSYIANMYRYSTPRYIPLV
jgi:hypothetical protein